MWSRSSTQRRGNFEPNIERSTPNASMACSSHGRKASAPIVPEFGDFDAAMLSERANVGPACAFETPRPSYDVCPSFGDMISEIDGWVPLAPISVPWTAPVAVYNYTANSPLPNGRFEQRQDLDLHNGIRGHLVDAGNAGVLGFTNYPVTFDPAVMGPGDHKEAVFWTQTASDASVVSALIVVDVQVDPNAPPPVLICQDPTATNVGGALPCVFAPRPPPPPAWVGAPAFFERQGDRWRLCDAAHVCHELVFKP